MCEQAGGREGALGRFDTELQPAGAARRPSAARRRRAAEPEQGALGGGSRDVGCRGRRRVSWRAVLGGDRGVGGRPADWPLTPGTCENLGAQRVATVVRSRH